MKFWTNVKQWLPGALIVALLCGLIGSTYAKYVTQNRFEGTVTLRAELGTIELWEHEAEKQDDGSYELDKTTEVKANTYKLIPGLDIDKDPFVRVKDKTAVPAYVFVEVVSTLDDSALTFVVDSANWLEISTSGKHGGTVYVYTGGTGAALAVTDKTENISEIYILKDNQVIVGQKLNSKDRTDLGLTFYASMYEVASGTDAADVYSKNS